MTNTRAPLDPSTDFVRHFSGTRVDDDKPIAGSLVVPPDHDGEMSIERLGVYSANLDDDLAEIRKNPRLTLRASGRLIRWNVGAFHEASQKDERVPALSFLADPILEDNHGPANPAHGVITGLASDTAIADLLLDLVRPIIIAAYPAKL